MKQLTILSALISLVILIASFDTIMDNQRGAAFKPEYSIEVLNSDSLRIKISTGEIKTCSFTDLKETISEDNK